MGWAFYWMLSEKILDALHTSVSIMVHNKDPTIRCCEQKVVIEDESINPEEEWYRFD